MANGHLCKEGHLNLCLTAPLKTSISWSLSNLLVLVLEISLKTFSDRWEILDVYHEKS